MASNASRGAYYKNRTRKWLESKGYTVFVLEVVRWVGNPENPEKRFPVKRDQLGSDLGAMKGDELIFVQVKSGKSAEGGNFPASRRKFAEFTFPSWSKRWVVAWKTGARDPRIVDCTETQRSLLADG